MRELPEGIQKVIHVNRPAVLDAAKEVFIIRIPGQRTILTSGLEIMGHAKLMNDPNQPQGKRVWVETYAKVIYE